MKTFIVNFKTELKLTLRGVDTVFFGILFPIVTIIIIGIVMGNGSAQEGVEYSNIDQSFGAIVTIGICATGLMGFPLTVADYRHRKILKRYQVTPVSPGIILFVQCLVNFIMSLISLFAVWLISKLFFHYSMNGSVIRFLGAFTLVTFAIYGIGMMLASVAPNIKIANLLCTILYFPMIFFSGATIPYEVMPKAAQNVMDFLPLTQGIKLLKSIALNIPNEHMVFEIGLMLGCGIVCVVISIISFKWE